MQISEQLQKLARDKTQRFFQVARGTTVDLQLGSKLARDLHELCQAKLDYSFIEKGTPLMLILHVKSSKFI